MKTVKNILADLGLNTSNSIVIGSGILEALGIRQSNDVDLVVTDAIYDKLKSSKGFSTEQSYGREILVADGLEVRTSWDVLDKEYKFEDFIPSSVCIDDVRYISLTFLDRVKKDWVAKNKYRDKDLSDISLIAKYTQQQD